MTTKAAAWFKSKGGNQKLARQLQRQPLFVAIINIRHGTARFYEGYLSHRQVYSLIILNDRRLSIDLKYGIAVINAIKTNIPLCPLAMVYPFAMANIVADFRPIKSEDVPRAN